MTSGSELPLRGKRILLVEDQALIALDLQVTLEDDGADVVGPFHRLGAAMRAASGDSGLDAAVLDVDLGREEVFPLADRLAERGVPIVFHTGYAEPDRLRARYGGAPVILKPARPGELLRRLRIAIARRGTLS